LSQHRLRCGYCGHEDYVQDDPALSVYWCSECGAKTSFGSTMPKIVNRPHAEDRRFIVSEFDLGLFSKSKISSMAFALDRDYARDYALDLLSVTDPEKHASWMKLTGHVPAATPPIIAPKPSPILGEDPVPRTCQCGNPSQLANGACAECVDRMLR
jgi:hypothetical protein